MKPVVKIQFGSHLYGTDTPESDKDYKGIFIPSKEQTYLGKIPKCIRESSGDDNSKNTSEDTDTDMYSLQYFIELACQGQTVALDMLHAPPSKIIESSWIWEVIIRDREKFYTKDMSAFMGYCQRQAAKYGIKGSRLQATREVLDILAKYIPETTLGSIWNVLPEGDHQHKYGPDRNGLMIYEVCGKKLQSSAKLGYIKDILSKFYDTYGDRAVKAMQNEGIDWKAISHALRVCYEMEELYTEGTITFPLKQAKLLTKIKQGEYDYNEIAPLLEQKVEICKLLSDGSEYPEKVDRTYWDMFVVQVMNRIMGGW